MGKRKPSPPATTPRPVGPPPEPHELLTDPLFAQALSALHDTQTELDEIYRQRIGKIMGGRAELKKVYANIPTERRDSGEYGITPELEGLRRVVGLVLFEPHNEAEHLIDQAIEAIQNADF